MENRYREYVIVVAKAVSTTFLLWAAFDHARGRNFYVLLRITVFLSALICLYFSKRNWLRLVSYGAIVVLFNPVLPFTLARGTWGLIDFTVGCFLGLSIFFRHSPHIGWLWASTLFSVGAIACVVTVIQGTVTGIRLTREGVRAEAKITDIKEVAEEGGYTYWITYRFQTMSGQWIEGDANRSEIPEPSVVPYYPADPKQNQLLDRDLSVLRRATADIFVQAIVGIFCAICGVFLARKGLTQFRLFSQRVSESVLP
jgi:hypothetical protein